MRFSFDHDYHIHSFLSLCSSDPEQSAQEILRYAKREGLKKIVITDHFWDEKVPCRIKWYEEQNFNHLCEIKPLPQADGVEFKFGCETEHDSSGVLGISRERYDEFDFIIIPTTHLHMPGYDTSLSAEDNARYRARLWVEKLESVLSTDLPFHKVGIAHLSCHLMNRLSTNEYIDTLNLIPEEEMRRLFTIAKDKGCGIELNFDSAVLGENADAILRPFKIAKECGCKFYLGSDAHHPSEFLGKREIFDRVIDFLSLTEDDKFHF